MRTNRRNSKGVTLLECLIYCAILTALALLTMRALGEAALVRGRGTERGRLILIAQEQLDEARRLPAADLVEAEETLRSDKWGPSLTTTRRFTQREDGNWVIDIIVARETGEGIPAVHLSTIRAGERT